MRIPNKIKKFSTLVDALHKNIDLTKYYITIYQGPDPFGRYIFGSTLIEVKEITANRVQVNHLIILYQDRTEYLLDIPDHLCKPVTPANPFTY